MENSNNKKSYYSINLTEGRIWLIFILFLITITSITFIFVLLLKNTSKKQPDIITSNVTSSSISSTYFDYHEKLGIEDKLLQEGNKKTSQSSSEMSTENKLVNETKKNEEKKIDIIDNSEVVYSSKYKETTDSSKSNINVKKQVNEKQNSKETLLKNEIRYAVQIGSYENRNLAEEISLYYKMQGYPTYIEEKTKDGKKYYRIRIGPFKEKNKAEKYLVSIKNSKYGKESMIWEFKL